MSDDPPSPTTAEHPAVQEDTPSDSGGSAVESGTVAHDPIISSVDVEDDDGGVFQWAGSPLSRRYPTHSRDSPTTTHAATDQPLSSLISGDFSASPPMVSPLLLLLHPCP